MHSSASTSTLTLYFHYILVETLLITLKEVAFYHITDICTLQDMLTINP
jgi:hypothetical protein